MVETIFDLGHPKIHTRKSMVNDIDIEAIAGKQGMLARAYTDPEVFKLEMERIFQRVWIFVGHESQVPKPGDFRRTSIGTNEVLLVRQKDYSLKTLLNNCSHRGTRLCAAVEGSKTSFVCPYHGWTFDLDGTLKGVPDVESYPTSFDINDPSLHLKSAPRLQDYRGFIFASLSEQGPNLIDYLGKMTYAI